MATSMSRCREPGTEMVDPCVFIVEDDASVRCSLELLICSCGFDVVTFATAREFRRWVAPPGSPPAGPACLVLDVQLPGLSGLELQEELAAADFFMPIVFISSHATVPMSVRAMQRGAVDFLTKPVDEEALLHAVEKAVDEARRAWRERAETSEVRWRLDSLTPREREVLTHVVTGKLNKQIANQLGITEKTVKVHRARATHKMRARSLADLVRLAEKVGIRPLED